MKVGDIVVIEVDAPTGTDYLEGFTGEVGLISRVDEHGDCLVTTQSAYTDGYWWSDDEIRLATMEECVAELSERLRACE